MSDTSVYAAVLREEEVRWPLALQFDSPLAQIKVTEQWQIDEIRKTLREHYETFISYFIQVPSRRVRGSVLKQCGITYAHSNCAVRAISLALRPTLRLPLRYSFLAIQLCPPLARLVGECMMGNLGRGGGERRGEALEEARAVLTGHGLSTDDLERVVYALDRHL